MDQPIAENDGFIKRLHKIARRQFSLVVDLVTPPLCLCCQAPVTMGAALCVSCWQKLTFIDEPVCDVLGTPFEYDQGEGAISPAAHAAPPHWDKARAAVVFDDTSKELVHFLKYQDRQEAGLAMARLMASAGRNLFAGVDVIMPVPLHRLRLWRRRFNQAAFLAQALSKHATIPFAPDVLRREKATSSQVGLAADERRRNVRHAFAVDAEKQHEVSGKTVLLIDDVRTTGATADACAACLKNAGAGRVFVLTFALVLEPQRLHIVA